MAFSLPTIVLVALLAVPVLFLFAPKLSAGLMVPAYEREARSFLQGAEVRDRAGETSELQRKKRKDIIGKLSAAPSKRATSSRLTIAKRLKFARWSIRPLTFHSFECLTSAVIVYVLGASVCLWLRIFMVFSGPVIMRNLLNFSVERRFKRFDADYPQFLMSIVGLLKTGMSPVNAIESAANGLDPKSLVRSEVNVMTERMRLGVAEERSVGSFAEDINHPEIELFIQALLLSKRVGGGLSDTLERLAKQVRKRQFFRNSAIAAVALQRVSAWMILGILVFLEVYIYKVYPALVVEGWKDPTGWMVWQGAIATIIVSILWSREVTKIKV